MSEQYDLPFFAEPEAPRPVAIPPPVGYDSWEAYHVAGLQRAKEVMMRDLQSMPHDVPLAATPEMLAFFARKPDPETEEQRALKAQLLEAAQRSAQVTQSTKSNP